MNISKEQIRNLSWGDFPRFTVTEIELKRLRDDWADRSIAPSVVSERVKKADSILNKKLYYPPLGGGHNQWYQCRKCQVPLTQGSEKQHQCPQCGRVYKGVLYDTATYAQFHNENIEGAEDCAWAYAITDDPKYAAKGVEILSRYAELYGTYPIRGNARYNLLWKYLAGGRLGSQTLDDAYALGIHIAPACDLLMGSPAMTGPLKKKILQGLIKPMLKVLGRYPCGLDNWQSFHITALIGGAALLEDKKWLERALIDKKWPWAAFVSSFVNLYSMGKLKAGWSLGFQLKNGVLKDGFWYESSWGYHYYTLEALIGAVEYGRRLGLPLWESRELKKMLLMPLTQAFSNGKLPGFGDSNEIFIQNYIQSNETAASIYGAEALGEVLPSNKNWFSVMYGRDSKKLPGKNTQNSSILKETGLGMIRTGDIQTAVSFGPFGGFHSHFDTLGFILHHDQKDVLVDSGKAESQAYGLPIHKNWYRSSLSHNVVLVDGKQQRASRGRLIETLRKGGREISRFETKEAYRDVLWRRTFIQGDDYLILLDRLESKKIHDYDQIFHIDGGDMETELKMTPCRLADHMKGGEYLQDGQEGLIQKEEQFRIGKTLIISDYDRECRVFTARGRRKSTRDLIPFLAFRKRAREINFTTLIIPDYKSKHDVQELLASAKEWIDE